MLKTLKTLCVLLCLSGCSAAMVMESSDPEVKLHQAMQLVYELHRAIPAKRLMEEAIDIYKQRQDKNNLAAAYMIYGYMLDSNEYREYAGYFQQLDADYPDSNNEKYDPTSKTSIKYFEKALQLYNETDYPQGRWQAYLHLAEKYVYNGEKTKTCKSYDMSVRDYAEALRRDPSYSKHVTAIPKNYSKDAIGYAAFIKDEKAKVPCQ